MNIFGLDKNPRLCAKYHYNVHTYKMLLESTQILSTVSGYGYKPTHKNHPCTLWCGESLSNFIWLKELGIYLNEEFKYRYNHSQDHKSIEVLLSIPNPDIKDIGLTKFALAMPDEFKDVDDIVAYRKYYKYGKAHLRAYMDFKYPEWFKEI